MADITRYSVLIRLEVNEKLAQGDEADEFEAAIAEVASQFALQGAKVTIDPIVRYEAGVIRVSKNDPRYCPLWLAEVPHNPHEFSYGVESPQTGPVTGQYTCEGFATTDWRMLAGMWRRGDPEELREYLRKDPLMKVIIDGPEA